MGAAPVLNIFKDGELVQEFELAQDALLGRGDQCDIRLEDRSVSRQHLLLRPMREGIRLEKKSEFGPLLFNGTDCTSAILKQEDTVIIGPFRLKVSLPGGQTHSQPEAGSDSQVLRFPNSQSPSLAEDPVESDLSPPSPMETLESIEEPDASMQENPANPDELLLPELEVSDPQIEDRSSPHGDALGIEEFKFDNPEEGVPVPAPSVEKTTPAAEGTLPGLSAEASDSDNVSQDLSALGEVPSDFDPAPEAQLEDLKPEGGASLSGLGELDGSLALDPTSSQASAQSTTDMDASQGIVKSGDELQGLPGTSLQGLESVDLKTKSQSIQQQPTTAELNVDTMDLAQGDVPDLNGPIKPIVGKGDMSLSLTAEVSQLEEAVDAHTKVDASKSGVQSGGGEAAVDSLLMDLESSVPETPESTEGVQELDTSQFNLEAVPELGQKTSSGARRPSANTTEKVATTSKLSVKLLIPPGLANVEVFELDKKESVLGRSKKCDIVLEDKKSSRRHAIIVRSGIKFILKDLSSANGTYLNGQRVADEADLSGEDIIRIGSTEMRFKATHGDFEQHGASAGFFQPKNQELSLKTGVTLPPPSLQSPDATQGYASVSKVSNIGLATVPGVSPVPPFGGVGIPGTQTQKQGKKSLWQQYRALSGRRKWVATVALIVLAYLVMDYLFEETPVTPKTKKTTTAQKGDSSLKTFETLSPDQQAFVKSQYDLAFQHYINQEYDKALYELEKIFQLINNYKDARDIERYALEGKRRQERQEKERVKREEEERLKARIAELTSSGTQFMAQKKYDEASALFPEVLALDPENVLVKKWQREIDDYKERKELESQQKRVQDNINKNGWELFSQAQDFKRREKYVEAMEALAKIRDLGVSNQDLLRRTSQLILDIRSVIRSRVEPLFEQATVQEKVGDIVGAYKLYEKMSQIDPTDRRATLGMDRIREVLEEKAKIVYTEAVMAESYSDFPVAKAKFMEVLNVAPKQSIYFERATRKLKRYSVIQLPEQQEEAGAGG